MVEELADYEKEGESKDSLEHGLVQTDLVAV